MKGGGGGLPALAPGGELRCPIQTDIFSSGLSVVETTMPLFIRQDDAAHTVLEAGGYDIGSYIAADLNVQRLDAIYGHMWLCGRPLNARPLHRQKMMKREILITEQADLHLVYYDNAIFIKPLPEYLLSPAIWHAHINKHPDLHKDACGFFLSYVWLLRTPHDFHYAKQENLVPTALDWPLWRQLVLEFFSVIDATSLHQVSRRYQFGELRLHRINSVYRLNPRFAVNHFVRGYLHGYNRYVAFYQRSVRWFLVLFVWLSVALSAMQVGTSLPDLMEKRAFIRAAFGFVVFAIVLVAALVVSVGVLFAIIYLYNMVAAISQARNQHKRREELAVNKKQC